MQIVFVGVAESKIKMEAYVNMEINKEVDADERFEAPVNREASFSFRHVSFGCHIQGGG